MHYVYQLVHPKTNLPFYVGMSKNPDLRFLEHKRSQSIVGKYIRVLGRTGITPIVDVIYKCDSETEAHTIEIETIKYYSTELTLLNSALYVGTPPVPELCGTWGEYCKKPKSCPVCRQIEFYWRFSTVGRVLFEYEELYFYDRVPYANRLEVVHPKKFNSLSLYIGNSLVDYGEVIISDEPFTVCGEQANKYPVEHIMGILRSEEYMFPLQKMRHRWKIDWWLGGRFDIKAEMFNDMPQKFKDLFVIDAEKLAQNQKRR